MKKVKFGRIGPPLCPQFWEGSSAACPLKIWDVMPPIPEDTFRAKNKKLIILTIFA